MSWTTSIKTDVDSRGHGIPDDQRKIAERLRSHAFAVQKNFDLAEHSALILAESLGDDAGSALPADFWPSEKTDGRDGDVHSRISA